MALRKQIGKKVRFEVFKRDSFTCQYCGSTPPKAILHVDHINPVALGGKNNLDNLITACSVCNIGKGATPLAFAAPSMSMADKAKEIMEREEQIRAYNEMLTEEADRIENDAWCIVQALENNSEANTFNRNDFQSIKLFLKRIPTQMVCEAVEITLAKIPYKSKKQFKYFCGVCWNMIREAEHA